ncbi:MAG: tRNA (adenosine(37)-N6)-threonylcarbamoyltransferase complex dimerization subunit type 1 TsaB [bacterium]|nr:tRNA (adenosine(37)-N6)-threonylcarbamoyltransferase complex dimerization subunit type 1 TsaB [bacterium]
MLVLGIDTSTTTGGVAIVNDTYVLANYQLDLTVTHSARLFPALDTIFHNTQLTIQDINGIAVAIGPGSFTGLRIGVMAAKSLAVLNRLPLIGISTLSALAFPLSLTNRAICSILDASRGEVYAAVYQAHNGHLDTIMKDTVIPLQNLLNHITFPCIFSGNGVRKFRNDILVKLGNYASFAPTNLQMVLPSSVAELGLQKLRVGIQDDPLKLEPHYLRRPEAELVWERKNRS